MRRLNCIAAALLAGSALITLPALAQESASPDAQQPILKQGGKSTETKSATQASPDQQAPEAGKAASEATQDLKRKPASQDEAGASDTSKTDRVTNNKQAADPTKRKVGTEDAAATPEPAPKKDSKAAAQAEGGTQGEQADTKSTTEATPGAEKKDQAAEGQQPSGETTASIDITNEQKIEITNVIKETNVEPVDVDFEVSVGVEVPTTIELRPLPPRIIEIVPAYRGYAYFVLADGRIIIVEPDTHNVVYVLAA